MEILTADQHGAIIDLQVETQLVRDDSGHYVAYCPALELSSYGDTETEARDAFNEALTCFKQDVAQRGTLNQLLLALGWQRHATPAAVIYKRT